MSRGVDMSKLGGGYYGFAFYVTPDRDLAVSNYADFAEDEGEDEPGAVVELEITDSSRILQLIGNDEDWERYQQVMRGRHGSDHNLWRKLVRDGVDGVADLNSMGGIAIYNKDIIRPIRIIETPSRNPHSSCPIRSQLYGGMPSGGGYGSDTEFEIGAQRIAEAAHCILGSLGKRVAGRPGWDDVFHAEKGHIDEENGIIQKCAKEYSRDLYTRRLSDPTRDVKSKYKQFRIESADATVRSIRDASPRLRKMANSELRRWKEERGVPRTIFDLGKYSYLVLISLADAMMRSVEDYPEYVTNPYRNHEFRGFVLLLDDAVKAFDEEAERVRAGVQSGFPRSF
jgi:hypothetical protein